MGRDEKNYQFTDITAYAGVNYYWIEQIDHDGKFSYSLVAMVNNKTKPGIPATPNPATDFIMISMNANLNPNITRVYDAGGRLVFKKEQIVNASLRIPLNRFVKGWYMLEVQREDRKYTQKILKQ